MAKYIYNNKIASARDIQSVSISQMYGVDYSSSNLAIADYHATDMRNMLIKNGSLQTISGWERILQTKEKTNGFWQIKKYVNGEEKIYTLALIGNRFYEIINFESEDKADMNFGEMISTSFDMSLIKNQKAFGVVAEDRIYVLCGIYAVFKLLPYANGNGYYFYGYRVYDDVDTYIPTTTIGISDLNVGASKRESYDAINMLSSKVINKCSTYYGDATTITLVLDSLISLENYPIVSSDVSYRIDDIDIQLEYLEDSQTAETKLIAYIEPNISTFSSSGPTVDYTVYVMNLYLEDSSGNKTEKVGTLFPKLKADNGKFVYSKELNETTSSIVLYKMYTPPVDGRDNLTIKFSKYVDGDVLSTDYELIENCRFGILYGSSNNRNRLFVSGNPNTRNIDYHSTIRNIYASDNDVDLKETQDFTYFGVYDTCAYGTTNSAVMGYQILGDGTLAIFKAEANNEPTLYFRKGTYTTKDIDYQGITQTVYVETYPMVVGNIGEGCICENAVYNLNNDICYLSRNGLVGVSASISYSSTLGDYKFAYKRSRSINSKLTFEDLKNCATAMYDDKIFITCKHKDDFITYVADGRYKSQRGDSIDNEYDYEWFVLNNVPAERYFVVNNKLYFQDEKGLCRWNLQEEIYKNRDLYRIDYVGMSPYGLYLGQYENVINNDTTARLINYSYYAYLDVVNISLTDEEVSNKCFWYTPTSNINNETILDVDKDIYFVNRTSENYKGTITEIDLVNHRYKIQFEDDIGELVDRTPTSTQYLCVYVKLDTTREYTVKKDVDNNGLTYYRIMYTEPLIIQNTLYYSTRIGGLQSVNYLIFLIPHYNIPCYFLTKIFNMGNSTYQKVLRNITIVNDSNLLSNVNFGIRTKDFEKYNIYIEKDKKNGFDEYHLNLIRSGTNGLQGTYTNIYNSDLTRGTFVTSFSKDCLIRFNFIQFVFYSNENRCVLNNIDLHYTFGLKRKGAM